jgi:hypothetical protein
VLDRVTDTVTKSVLVTHLSPLEPWSSAVPERKEVSVTLNVRSFPVLRSVRQHQEGATLSYFMVSDSYFIFMVRDSPPASD